MKRILLTILSFLLFLWPIQPTPSNTYDSIFSFGDSYTDTGNVNVLAKKLSFQLYTDKLPYGETFFHHPTGRFCDGRLIVDFLAEEFGLPYLQPYLAQNGSFQNGANFAVSGATTLKPAFFMEHNITTLTTPLNTSLEFQLQWFEELKPSLCHTLKDCRHYFGRSLFMVGEIGGNDYLYMFLSRLNMTQMRPYVSTIVQTIANTTKKLIDQGARTVVVPGNIPMGCLPMLLTTFKSHKYSSYDHETGCIKRFNTISRYHNRLLFEAVKELRVEYPRAKIIYADYYRPIYNFVRFPKFFGFTSKPLRACCGKTGEYNWNLTEVCGMPHVNACQKPSEYVNWDGVHLTEASYRYISNSWLKGPYADPPILDAHTV